MDTAQWPQEIVVKPIEEIIVTNSKSDVDQDQNNKRDHHEQEVLKCPRCNSGNTKFCYYNNYSLTQPRFFCKACRRYWTQGGSLRNIPVGGASRKINKIRSSSSSSSKIINNRLPDLVQGQDLNLALTRDDHHTKVNIDGSNNTSFGMNMMINHSFVHPHPLTTASSASFGFSLNDNNNNNYNTQEQDFKPSLDFSLDGISGSGGGKNNNANNGRLLFPFEDYLKGSNGINVIEPSNNNNNNNSSNNSNIKDQEDFPITGYWTGMLGGGSW